MTPADRLLWAMGLLWLAFIAIGLALVIARKIVDRLRPRRRDLFVNRSPDERLHRPGSVVDFQRYLSARTPR
jgi:hypothetical protein